MYFYRHTKLFFMRRSHLKFTLLLLSILSFSNQIILGQGNFKRKFKNSSVFAGIEVGAKGVKLSLLEVGKNAQSRGAFNILKDSSVNTDFISFNDPSFHATLDGFCGLYATATQTYNVPSKCVFTVVSSGVKVQAEKDGKMNWINNLIDSFKIRINEPKRNVEVVDVVDEARLSHLGIVPDEKRYNTFLIDIGSGNTKGGFFPYGNISDFKLFQVSWGTKSTANATERILEDDKTLDNYYKQLQKVLSGAENSEIIYAVNASGAYPVSDNVAFSGGIAWSLATLMHPEMIDNSVIPVTYDEVVKFSERIYKNYPSILDAAIVKSLKDVDVDKDEVASAVKTVNKVFDQKSLMAGTGLLLKIMRQFESIRDKKEFYLVKNGQVGWISAYVDQTITK
jgi:hypothetical protein